MDQQIISLSKRIYYIQYVVKAILQHAMSIYHREDDGPTYYYYVIKNKVIRKNEYTYSALNHHDCINIFLPDFS